MISLTFQRWKKEKGKQKKRKGKFWLKPAARRILRGEVFSDKKAHDRYIRGGREQEGEHRKNSEKNEGFALYFGDFQVSFWRRLFKQG